MAKFNHKSLIHRAQFNRLIVNIENDINKLQLSRDGRFYAERFESALNTYTKSAYTIDDYRSFRSQALSIKNTAMSDNDLYRADTKQIICNIVLGILGLGIIYGLAVGINYLVNNKALLFKPEIVRKIDAVYDDIDALKNNGFTTAGVN